MEVSEHVGELAEDGRALARAALDSGLGATVPTCPGWTVRDLLRHLGGVHRWAAAFVEGRTEAWDVDLVDVVGSWPADTDLVEWFLNGHGHLVDRLRGADPTLACWTFLPAASPLAMWARRQAHETAIHRVDAEAAAGRTIRFRPTFASDGIDELLACFVGGRGHRLRSEEPHSLAVQAQDTGRGWLVSMGPDGARTTTGAGPADCTVTGSSSDLYIALWNRRPLDGIAVEGEAGLIDLFLDRVQIRWS